MVELLIGQTLAFAGDPLRDGPDTARHSTRGGVLIDVDDRTALPVVDSDGVLLGIVTVDDVLDVAEEEATEDFQKLGSESHVGSAG